MEDYNGTYMVYYEGAAGFGNAAAIIDNGVIRGKDCVAGDIKGMARIEGNDLIINVTIYFTGAPGTFSVVNGEKGSGLEQTLEFRVPKDFPNEALSTADTVAGPLRLRIIRL
ncbi:hypothetical protein [Salidesulfovibrio brasiliensis]|uniref:hypothetical protein n=1 Tax=Salidesulfovibrio brasiliensis TaxID=221711 RepID=UPI0006CFA6A1|nr:hypothetical protein [Salidesulfovibrio brasiliensis]